MLRRLKPVFFRRKTILTSVKIKLGSEELPSKNNSTTWLNQRDFRWTPIFSTIWA